MLPEIENQENALEARGINPQTELPDNVTLSGDATSVRFHSSRKTGGYVKKEVDEYIVNVIAPSLEWFKNALERRDQEVYRLGQSIEDLERQIINLGRDIESANMNNMILSSKRENEEDKEMAALMEQNVELRQRLESVSAGGAVDTSEYDELIASYRANEEAYQHQINEMTAYVSQLEVQLGSTQTESGSPEAGTELQAALEQVSVMEKDLQEFQTYVDQIQEYTNGLEEQVSSLEAQLATASSAEQESVQLKQQLEEYEQLISENQTKAEELLNEQASYATEIDQKNSEIAQLTTTLEQLNSQVAEAGNSSEYEEAYNTVTAQLAETVEQANESISQYEQRITELENELNEAVERANEYYEHYLTLQQAVDAGDTAPGDSEASLISARNAEISAQLDQATTELAETQENYAALYEAYEEVTSALPENGIVSMDDYAAIKVALDEANSDLAQSQKQVSSLEKQIEAAEAGLLTSGATIENYKQVEKSLEELTAEHHELTLKYETLLARKQPAETSDQSDGETITYSEEEYTEIYTHATEAIEQYNELVSVHEELRTAYEELLKAHQTAVESVQQGTPPEPKKKGGLPVKAEIPVAPQGTGALPDSKYSEKKLPEGITLEDLQ